MFDHLRTGRNRSSSEYFNARYGRVGQRAMESLAENPRESKLHRLFTSVCLSEGFLEIGSQRSVRAPDRIGPVIEIPLFILLGIRRTATKTASRPDE